MISLVCFYISFLILSHILLSYLYYWLMAQIRKRYRDSFLFLLSFLYISSIITLLFLHITVIVDRKDIRNMKGQAIAYSSQYPYQIPVSKLEVTNIRLNLTWISRLALRYGYNLLAVLGILLGILWPPAVESQGKLLKTDMQYP